ITVPLAVVPLTMQTFAVPLTGAVLGAKRGAVAMSVYVLLGALAVPVFQGFTGGVGIIAGPTGGFLLAFPLYAAIVGAIAGKDSRGDWRSRVRLSVGLLSGGIALFTVGGIAYPLLRGFAPSVQVAFAGWVAPFILGDLIKLAMVAVIAPVVRRAFAIHCKDSYYTV
ncbi:MAG: biotin transporter BioY, partial [Oscillospiraceae bacterium]|nr:biotin transporter BioY [Oscillospiraceae bacterium]